MPRRFGLARHRWTRKGVFATTAVLIVVVALTGVAVGTGAGNWGTSQVGSDDGQGVLLPDGQRVSPAGTRHLVTNGRLLSSTVSPDGTKLAALSAVLTRGYLTVM